MKVPITDLHAQYQELRQEIDAAISGVLRTSSFVGGEEVSRFEAEFAAYCSARFAVGVGNGTDGLRLALQALGIGRGDAVLTVPFTFVATVEAIVQTGAEPVFVDIADEDFNIDAAAIERFLYQQTEACGQQRMLKRGGSVLRAIMPVHLYGLPASMAAINSLARSHGLWVVEDAAQAVGARCWIDGVPRRVGSIGDVAVFSLFPAKNLGAMGDGGVVTTNDEALARRLRQLADHGQSEKYVHVLAHGGNSRLDGLQAAILRVKLRRLDAWNTARRCLARRYDQELRDLPMRLPRVPEGRESVYHQYSVRVEHRDQFRRALSDRGIASSVHYPIPVHRQIGFAHLGHAEGSYPVAEQCAREVVSLPLWAHMSEEHGGAVIAAIRQVLVG